MSRRVKRKRSKGLVIVLLPALIFIAAMGWVMYVLGEPRKKAVARKRPEKDPVTLLPAVFGDQDEILVNKVEINH